MNIPCSEIPGKLIMFVVSKSFVCARRGWGREERGWREGGRGGRERGRGKERERVGGRGRVEEGRGGCKGVGVRTSHVKVCGLSPPNFMACLTFTQLKMIVIV